MLIGFIPMKEIKKTNIVIVKNFLQGQEERGIKRNFYTIDVNRKRNYYSCRGFDHLAKNCKN